MTEYLNVGKIVNTQGIKGEVRVISRTDFPEERYKKGNTLYLFQNNDLVKPLTIASYRVHKNFVLLSFEGHPSINDVEIYRDGILKVAKEDTQELDDYEFYYHEIIGCDVYDETRGLLGKVKEILSPGANDVWVIQVLKGKDILIPYIESVVLNVDVTTQRIDVSLPEGLVDDED